MLRIYWMDLTQKARDQMIEQVSGTAKCLPDASMKALVAENEAEKKIRKHFPITLEVS